MIIQRIEVRNFRALKEVDVDCHELLAILGRNGSGKSTILKALDAFYNVSFLANEYDYFAKDTTSEITIRVTYGDLRADELQEFGPYLSGRELTVSKVINAGVAKYYGVAHGLEEFNQFRTMGALPKRKAINELIELNKYPDFGPKVKTDAEANQLMDAFEKKHPELLKPFQRQEQFFGPTNVGGGKLDNFTKFVLVPAVRDAASETERRGVILQLIDVLVARSVNARKDVVQLNEDFAKRAKEVYNSNNLTELSTLAGTITKLLSQYAPGAALDLSFAELVPPKISLPSAHASLVEDDFKSPISYSGHGLQRALVLALLQQLCLTDLTLPKETEKEEGGALNGKAYPEDKKPLPIRIPDLILAIEEPELYQHPSRSRFLAAVLGKLSIKSTNAGDPRTQVLYATHSPYFIDIGRFERVRLARKIPTTDVPVLQTKVTAFSRKQGAAKLAEIAEKDPKEFTDQSFVAHVVPVMNSTVNEGFFADVVVVVEGLTEVAILWALQDLMGKNWDGLSIVVVPAEGKTKLDRPVVIFRGLGIPTYLVFDGDGRKKGKGGKNEQSTIATNKLLLRLAGVKVEDFPLTQVQKEWASFFDDAEAELAAAVGAPYYQEIREEIAGELGYGEPSKAVKNPEACARLVQRIYKDGKALKVFEDIVNAITNLRGY